MRKLILMLILGLFLISLASAELVGTFQQSSCVNLPQTCDDCTYVKISSILYPNSSLALGEVTMTKTGTFYNYSFCDTNVTGTYFVNGYGDESGIDKTWKYGFEITPSGMIQSNSQGLISIAIMISIIFSVFFFGALAFKLMDYEKIYPIAMFFLVLSIIIAMFGMYLGFTYSRDYLYSASSEPYGKLFVGVLISLTGVAFIIMLGLIIAAVKEISDTAQHKKYGEAYNTKTKSYEN